MEISSGSKRIFVKKRNFLLTTHFGMGLRTTGTDLGKILPPVSRFGGGNRDEVKKNVIERLKVFFEKYFWV